MLAGHTFVEMENILVVEMRKQFERSSRPCSNQKAIMHAVQNGRVAQDQVKKLTPTWC